MLLGRNLALISSLGLLPAVASANGGASDLKPRISDGDPVATCGWPSVVAVSGGGLCTGTLVAPNLIAYAAHCGAGQKKIRFSEDNITGQALTPEFCMTNPAYSGQGNDWAFCKLQEDVEIPVTPVVFGCETDILKPGEQVAIIGFGKNNDIGGAGTKRWSMTTLLAVSWQQNITQIGGNGQASICPGDSGGPMMIKYPDGSWHSFGIASTYNGVCGSGGIHSLLPGAVDWIEENSGVDITPCHDADGAWHPTPQCQGFYTGDETGSGTWSDWCTGTPAGGSSETCGAAFDAVPDADAPNVAITFPADGQEFESGVTLELLVDALDTGWGVQQVSMKIDGKLQAITDDLAPYQFKNVQFPDGTWELVAVAEDWAGNVGESVPVKIGVGGPVEEDPDTGGDETGTGGDGTGDGTGGGTDSGGGDSGDDPAAGGAAENDGCGCSGGRGGAGAGWAGLLVVLAAGLRRRRSAFGPRSRGGLRATRVDPRRPRRA